MLPPPLVIVTPDPAVSVALLNVLPLVLPIKSWPSVYEFWPVPPLATATAVPFQVPVLIVPSVVMLLAPSQVPAAMAARLA